MEEVDKQIAEKVIEKSSEDPTPNPVEEKPKPKPKKPRTQKQQEAFAKARAKRLENIAKKKIEEETAVEDQVGLDPNDPFFLPSDEPPKPKKRGRGRPRGGAKLKKEEPLRPPHNYPHPVQHQIPQPVNHGIPTQPSSHGGFNYSMPYPQYQPPPQVHNYYYGANPQTPSQPVAEKPPVKFVVESSEEEEEVEEEVEYANPEYIQEPEPQFKYRFC